MNKQVNSLTLNCVNATCHLMRMDDQLAGSGAARERARALKHHASATGMTCLPSARPGHLLRSGGSELGRDGAAYLSYRLTCCETPVCRVTDWFGGTAVPVS